MANGGPTITIPANIEKARAGAAAAAARAGEYAAGKYTVGDIIKRKATEAYKASQDIIQPLDVATQEYLQAPQVAREKYQDIFNPFAREQLVGQYTGTQALPMLSLSSILGQRFGRIEDITGAGTRAYQAQAAQAQQAAILQRQSYQDLLGEYQMRQQLEQQAWQRQQQLEQQAWERPYQERTYEYALGKPYYKETGGGGGGTGFEALLNYILQPGAGGVAETPPPFPSGAPGARPFPDLEWPQGSGTWWEADGVGGWR